MKINIRLWEKNTSVAALQVGTLHDGTGTGHRSRTWTSHYLALLGKFLCLTQTVNAQHSSRHVCFWRFINRSLNTHACGLSPCLPLLLYGSLILQSHPWLSEYLWAHYVQSTGWLTAASRLLLSHPACLLHQRAAATASCGGNYGSQSTVSALLLAVCSKHLWEKHKHNPDCHWS